MIFQFWFLQTYYGRLLRHATKFAPINNVEKNEKGGRKHHSPHIYGILKYLKFVE